MLTSFNVQNFKSILDLTVDFMYHEAAPRGWQDMETLPFLQVAAGRENRSVPVLAIYGANASGKTNIIEAVSVFQMLLRNGVTNAFVPNKLNALHATCRFSAKTLLDGKRYVYSIEFDSTRVISETLHDENAAILFSITNKETNFSGITTELYDAEKLKDIQNVECTDGKGEFVRPMIFRLATSFAGLNKVLTAVVEDLTKNLHVAQSNEFFISQGVDLLTDKNQNIDPEMRRAKALKEIARRLKRFDFGIEHLLLRRQTVKPTYKSDGTFERNVKIPPGTVCHDDGDDFIIDKVTSHHKNVNGQMVEFNFMNEESLGTKVSAGLIGIFLWALENGKTIFVDELDRSLHPFILVTLIRMFKSKRYNRKNARLVFTVHDTTPLDENELRSSEVGIVSKTLKDGTTLCRLSDYDGVRNVHNFRKQYLDGVYGGIPFPYV